MESLYAYIPADRRLALAAGADLPERAVGAALFADISGFTPLTEALVRALGPQRGAEELPRQLNLIYDALIDELDRYGGSVISFSGDAITCWFDDLRADLAAAHPAAHRAAACALAMQRAMGQFASVAIPGAGTVTLAIKVAVAAGPVRRFVVGDPAIHQADVLAGETLARLASAEHLAEKGDVILDGAAVAALGPLAAVREWRTDEESGERFAAIDGLAEEPAAAPWPALAPGAIPDATASAWLLPPVYERLQAGQGEFLTELRPAVALFLRFGGIDYDGDEQARQKLDDFVRQVQAVLRRYDSYMVQLTVGDKGSYLYAAFGAPVAHEDDAVRAAAAALALRDLRLPFIGDVQIGVSQGRMRTGAYGGVTRRTYGVLGDEVNMAARLMQAAPPGEALVSLAARKTTGDLYAWEPLPPLRVKGKTEPVTVFRLLAEGERRALRLHEPRYARPMVGRRAELARAARLLDEAAAGRGQVLGVVAEAGMGKSRLVAELIRLAGRRRVVGFGGECQSYGTSTSYLVWRPIWRAVFGVEPGAPPQEQIAAVERALAAVDLALLPRLPLLGAALDIDIPDSELTATFDAKLRKASLEALLADVLRARAAESPLLLVLEDCHWIDPLSHDLLEVIGRAAADLPVLVALAYRPPQLQRVSGLRVSRLAHFSEIALASLPPDEVAELARAKVEQLFGSADAIAPDLLAQLAARAEGNPFYIEELLHYLHDQGVDPSQPGAMQQIDLPSSLHSLILSRIDRLSESQRTMIKVASVIGRLFHASMLFGISGAFGLDERLRRELDALIELELTAEDTPEPELVYLFKHIVTQEVAYESLPFATRAALHEQIGLYLEERLPDASGRSLDLLAYHYDRSRNDDKRRTYLLRAGDAARADYANEAAVDYYGRALPLLAGAERCAALLRLGQVLETVGRWDDAGARYADALALAMELGDGRAEAEAAALTGELLRKQGQYALAAPWVERALAGFQAIGDSAGSAQALHFAGSLAMHQGQYDEARARYDESLAIRRALDDRQTMGSLLSNLSIVAYHLGDVDGAWALAREALALRRSLGNKLWVANSLGNMGMLAMEGGQADEARAYMDEALALEREVGDRSAIAISLNNLGSLARDAADYERARALLRESLAITRDLGDSWALCYLLEDIGCLTALRGAAAPALQLAAAAGALRETIGAPLSPPEQASLERRLDPSLQALGERAAAERESGRALSAEQAVALALSLEL